MLSEEIMEIVTDSVTSEVFGVWFLIGAALVFFMQAGFAMVETANDPLSILNVDGIQERAAAFAEQIRKNI